MRFQVFYTTYSYAHQIINKSSQSHREKERLFKVWWECTVETTLATTIYYGCPGWVVVAGSQGRRRTSMPVAVVVATAH